MRINTVTGKGLKAMKKKNPDLLQFTARSGLRHRLRRRHAVGQLTGRRSTVLLFSTRADSWADPLMYLRLFTHVLGHADWGHLLANMSYILLLGPIHEEKYGWKDLLLVIAVTAFVTGVIHNVLFPGTILLGASGVVFAFILLTSFTEFREGEIPLTFILVAVLYLGQQIWDGLTVRDK